jgi:transcriptional regulator with XRE-family HTH domain
MAEARSFRELLAERVRRRRRQIKLTQDELARLAWTQGNPSMTRGVIAAVERGTADLTLPQLAVLVRVLATDLKSLLGSGDKVFIDTGVAIKVDDLVAQVLGHDTDWDFTTDPSARIVRGRHGTVMGFVSPPIGVAEHKASRRLGVSPEEVARAAGSLWSRSLAEERDLRLSKLAPRGASARTRQALRGHMTRTLLKELEPALQRETTPKPRTRGKP